MVDKNNNDWENHKLLIMKTIDALENDYKSLEHVFMAFRLSSQEEFHKFSTEIDKKLKIMSDDIVKLQVKMLLISSGLTLFITCIAQAIIKILIT